MYLKRLAAVAVCICIALASVGCNNASKEYTAQRYTPFEYDVISETAILENSNYALEFTKSNGRVLLLDKSTNTYWGTVPAEKMNVQYDEYGMPIKIHPQLESSVYIDYIPKGSTSAERLYAYSDSVSAKTYKAEKNEDGLSITYGFAKTEISVTVDYSLSKYGIRVSIDPKKICEGTNKVCAISVSPFFCSVKNNSENGYLFVPSGSGALIYPREVESGAALSYAEEIYGRDLTVNYPSGTKLSDTQSIRIPVFGAKDGLRAVCAIIEQGAELAEICAQIGSKNIGYSTVYAKFNVRGKQLVYSDIGSKTYENEKYSEGMASQIFSVIYSPLVGEKADYMGMAACYRDYLVSELSIDSVSEETSTALEFVGGVMTPSTFLGVPYESLYTATTYKQVIDIVSDFSSKTGISPSVLLSGYSPTGIDIGKVAGGFKPSSKFGDSAQLKKISDSCTDIYMDFDIVRFSKGMLGYKTGSNAARGANGQIAYQYQYNIWSGVKDESKQRYVLLERDKLMSAAEKIVKNKKEFEYGICFSTLSSLAYSDYTDGQYVSKSGMSDDVSNIYGVLDINSIKTASKKANIYAALASSYIFEAPISSSEYDVFGSRIPFYQMVLKGLRPMSSIGINCSDYSEETILRAAEGGMSIAFLLSGSYDHTADSAHTQLLNETAYSDISEWVCKTASDYDKYFGFIKNAAIVEHKIISENLRITTFDNGVSVCVNYSDKDAATPFGTVDAKSYCYYEGEVES